MSEREAIAFGDAPEPVAATSHHEGFDRALDKALRDLDGDKYAGQTLQVLQFVVISRNPGGVGQYRVELVPGGGG